MEVDQYQPRRVEMLIAEAATIQAIVVVLQTVPIGTNLGLAHVMWAMANGSFLSSRGGIFPALQLCGMSAEEIRQSWSALRKGSWEVAELISSLETYAKTEAGWRENRYEGYRAMSVDTTGFWRPRLKGWLVKHFSSIAGKALPAVVFGIIVISGQIGGKRVPLLKAIVRWKPEESKSEFHIKLLKQAGKQRQFNDICIVDAGLEVSEIHEAKLSNYVARLAKNCTARRNKLPKYKGKGARPKYGEYVRPLARMGRNDNLIPATEAEHTCTFEFEERTITVSYWHDLVLSTTKVSDDAITFSIYLYHDPDYQEPLILATDIKPKMAQTPYLLYNDRWTAEHPPLAAKHMIGLHRHFVFATESCFRLPELAFIVGSILTLVSASNPPIPSGFWDRKPQPTPGRLRNALRNADFPSFSQFDPHIRKKNSVSQHLPKGIHAHRRHKLAA